MKEEDLLTIWAERFRAHSLWTEVTRARTAMNRLSIDPRDSAQQDALAYAGAVLEHLEERQRAADPLEVTPAMLDKAAAAVSVWASGLEAVLADQAQMSDVIEETDLIMTGMASWPPMRPARYLAGLYTSLDAFAGKVSARLEPLTDEADHAQSRLAELTAAEDALAEKIDLERQRIAEAIAVFSTDSAQAVEDLLNEQRTLLDQELATWRNTDDTYREEARALLEDLKKHELSAQKTVHAAVRWTIAGDYGKYARGQSFAAWICDIGAALVGAGGLFAILYHLFTIDPEADMNVGLSLTRFAVSVAALGIAAVLGRRGAQHHREARIAKRTDLALTKLGPFIADLPDDEQQLIVQEFTDRVFIRGDLESTSDAKRPALRDQIVQLRQKRAQSDPEST